MTAAHSRLMGRSLLLVVGVTFLYFVGFGVTIPVLPMYVVEELGRSELTVGMVFGAYAVAATVFRPAVGRAGDRRGRRYVLIAGGVVTALGLLTHVLATSVPLLVAARLVVGIGHAAVMVAATTLALDLAPPDRRGESSSYVMVAIQVGMGLGPVAGELLARQVSFAAAWVAAAGCSAVCAAGALAIPRPARRRATIPTGTMLHPAGLGPGILVGLSLIGFAGYLAFAPLYGPSIGVRRVAVLFLLASGTVAVVRLLGARIPDRLGGRRGARLSLAVLTVAFAGMALWDAPLGLCLMTVLMAVGVALVVPSLILVAIDRAPAGEHSRVMATFTLFVDVAAALGPTLLGALAGGPGYSVAFGTTAGIALVALLVVLRRGWPRRLAVPDVDTDPVPNTARR